MRGTPLLVQLYFVFYVFPTWGLSMPALATGIVGLGIYYSATASEIYRAGIEELSAGQWEAALVLGLPIRRVWLGIVLPQAIKTVLPMLGNQVVAMFKETSLLSTITVIGTVGREHQHRLDRVSLRRAADAGGLVLFRCQLYRGAGHPPSGGTRCRPDGLNRHR